MFKCQQMDSNNSISVHIRQTEHNVHWNSARVIDHWHKQASLNLDRGFNPQLKTVCLQYLILYHSNFVAEGLRSESSHIIAFCTTTSNKYSYYHWHPLPKSKLKLSNSMWINSWTTLRMRRFWTCPSMKSAFMEAWLCR